MSLGLQYLQSILDSSSRLAFLETRREWFLEAELPAFDFVLDHYRQYDEYPSEEALRRAGIQLQPAQDGIDYYRQQLIARSAYNAINGRLNLLGQAMQSRNVESAVEIMREMLGHAHATRTGYGISSLADEAQRVLHEFDLARYRPGIQGVTLGYAALDEALSGAQPGDLVFLVGRPGVGKTYILLECMRRAWIKGHPTMLASMEMTPTQLVRRFVSTTSGVDLHCIRRGELSLWSQRMVRETVQGYTSMPPVHLMVGEFRKSITDVDIMIQETGPDICYIDAGYLLTPERRTGGRAARWEVISNVAEELKAVAINRGIPLLVTIQFNREHKETSKRDPDLADLAGSDAIGQIASAVVGIMRAKGRYRTTRRVLQLIKNREGPLLKFYINYLFGPTNFDYLGLVDEVDQAPAADLSYMV